MVTHKPRRIHYSVLYNQQSLYDAWKITCIHLHYCYLMPILSGVDCSECPKDTHIMVLVNAILKISQRACIFKIIQTSFSEHVHIAEHCILKLI